MSRFFRDWALGAKLMSLAVVGFLLTFGLCSVGTGFEGHGTPGQDFAANAGLLCFGISLLMFVVGLIALIVRAFTR
jgi:hypothetical protein